MLYYRLSKTILSMITYNGSKVSQFRKFSSVATNLPSMKKYKNFDQYYCIITGISRFSNRRDVENFLKPLNIVKMEALIDEKRYPTGDWAIKFPKDYTIPQIQSFFTNSTVKVKRFVDDSSISKISLASHLKITNHTITLRRVPKNFNSEHIRRLFESYQLRSNSIRVMNADGRFFEYLIHFFTPDQARRASVEIYPCLLDGVAIDITYNDL